MTEHTDDWRTGFGTLPKEQVDDVLAAVADARARRRETRANRRRQQEALLCDVVGDDETE